MPAGTLDLIAPAYHWTPPRSDTAGGEVADLCAAVNFTPDPEQQLILDAAFATPVVRDIGIVAPRQNLKTGVLKMMALGWLFLTEERLTVWSAHEFSTAQEAFRDMCVLLESHPDLEREVLAIHRASGGEAIELKGDRRLRFKARTKGGGRGLTGNRIILDEAMYLRPDHMGALIPTLRAVRDPQLVYAGSAGLLESAEWRRIRDRGRAGDDDALAYVEWGDPQSWTGCADGCTHAFGMPGCALDDEARWWATNTALTAGRITVDTLRADRRTLPWLEFARETLGWWEDPPADGVDEALANWPACAAPTATLSDPVHLGIDVSPNMASGAIVAAGWDGVRTVVEVVEHRRGTAWIPDRLAELVEAHKPASVGLVAGSPAAALMPDLPDTVTELKAAETTAACATFARAVTDEQVAHLDQAPLNDAVAAGRRKFSGDGWRWSRRDSDGDIAPLYAATVARHLLTCQPPPVDPVVLMF
jgi:hypothetical protein